MRVSASYGPCPLWKHTACSVVCEVETAAISTAVLMPPRVRYASRRRSVGWEEQRVMSTVLHRCPFACFLAP